MIFACASIILCLWTLKPCGNFYSQIWLIRKLCHFFCVCACTHTCFFLHRFPLVKCEPDITSHLLSSHQLSLFLRFTHLLSSEKKQYTLLNYFLHSFQDAVISPTLLVYFFSLLSYTHLQSDKRNSLLAQFYSHIFLNIFFPFWNAIFLPLW